MRIEPWDQERLLLFGQEGTGKTRAVWGIAARYRNDKSPGHFYYLDIDRTTNRFKTSHPTWQENMTIHEYATWQEMTAVLTKWRIKATKDDWLVLDGCGETWLEAQGEYWRISEGQSLSDAATSRTSGGSYGGAHGANWDRINKLYRDLSTQIVRWPGHVFACTAADKLGEEVAAIYNRYSDIGWRPSGQKYLGHHFHTVIFMQELGSGWRMTSVKDREREKVKMKRVGDFSKDYLEEVAKWMK